MSSKEKKAAESSNTVGFLDKMVVKSQEEEQQPRRVTNQDDDLKLPENFKVARAIGGGDCFFDSVAKGLEQIRVDEVISIKLLRELCHKYAIENEWVKSAVVKDARIRSNLLSTFKDDDIWNAYLFRICYTGDDMKKLKSSDEDLYSKLATNNFGETLLTPIWGRAEIEGRIVCKNYNVKLHIVEKHNVDGKRIRADQFVDHSGSKSVASVNYNDVNTIHILNGGKAHFRPILDTQKFKHKRQSPDPSDYNKEITPEEELINTIKSSTLKEYPTQLRKHSEKHKVQTRKGTTGGLDGHLYEINLLILVKFRAQRYIDKFYLTTNMGGVGAFDDIVFRYWNKEKSTLILLQAKHLENPINHKVTIEKFTNQKKDSKFYLGKYFVDYLKIRNFSKLKSKDPGFQGDFRVRYIIYTNAILDEKFDKARKIDIDNTDSIFSTEPKENKIKTFKFSLDSKNSDLITMLENVSCQERIESLAKALVNCISGKLNYNNMMGNELFSTYHVFLAKTVIDIREEIKIDDTKVEYREGKFKNDFFYNDNNDQSEGKLKDEVLYKYAKKVMFNKKSSTELGDTDKRNELVNKVAKLCVGKDLEVNEDIIQKLGGSVIILDEKDRILKFANEEKSEDESVKQFIRDLKSKVSNLADVELNICYKLVQKTLEKQLQKEPLKLHVSFGNISPRFRKPKHLVEQLIKLFEEYKYNKVIEIDDNIVGTGKVLTDGDIKNIGRLVGNLLVFDQEKKMLRLAREDSLDENGLNLLTELKKTDQRDLDSYRFDIKVKKFPKVSLDVEDEDRTNVEEFFNELEVLTGQANAQELRKIIKKEIKDLYKLTEKEVEDNFLKIKEKGEEYWRSEEKYYLEKNDGFFEKILKFGIAFDLRNSKDSFTGRDEQLKKLHKALQSRGETAISQISSISGLGGIGKTELARKYAFDYRNDYDGNVIWINSESYDTLSESFRRLAHDKLGINVKDKHINSIVEEVYDFFSKRKSLFIFDNAEKRRTQVDGDEGIDNFLPSLPSNSNKPYILITSRNQKWGENIEVIKLGIFSEREASDFIRKELKIKDNSQKIEIQNLSETLQQFPLALTQAVAYIKQVDEQIKYLDPARGFNIEDYLIEFAEKKKKLLDFQLPNDSNDKYNRTTFTTFRVSIDKIKKEEYGKKALEILEILAYCGIHSGIFLDVCEDDDDLIREVGAAIQLLTQYSMVDSDDGILSVHRLVKAVIQINLRDEKRQREALRKFIYSFKFF